MEEVSVQKVEATEGEGGVAGAGAEVMKGGDVTGAGAGAIRSAGEIEAGAGAEAEVEEGDVAGAVVEEGNRAYCTRRRRKGFLFLTTQ